MCVRKAGLISWGAFLLLIGACAHPGTRPDDMSEEAHLQAAALHRQEAARARHASQADARPRAFPLPTEDYRWTSDIYDPYGNDLRAERLERAAEEHARAAQALRDFEEASCKAFDPKVRASCPLVRGIERVEETPRGVRLIPLPGIDLDALTAHVRCHAAFARARAYEGMSGCPLYLKGVRVIREGDALFLEADDARTRALLLERARNHVHGSSLDPGG